jgi:hypothetical protein
MRVPSAEELAAIAAAYLVLTARERRAETSSASRWRLAARLDDDEPARVAVRTSRWNAASRLGD